MTRSTAYPPGTRGPGWTVVIAEDDGQERVYEVSADSPEQAIEKATDLHDLEALGNSS